MASPDMWIEAVTLPDEHQIFRATEYTISRSLPRKLVSNKLVGEFGAWAIGDRSGITPDRTDDGILWLNFNKNIMLRNDTAIYIPVIAPDGEESVVSTNVAGLFYLMDRFRWTANVVGSMYRVVRW